MMDYQRLDKVLAHIDMFATHDEFYRSLQRQWNLLHRLSEKQVQAVEKNMASDLQWLHDWEVFAMKKWQEQNA